MSLVDTLLYWLGKSVVLVIQCLPLTVVARLGRLGGAAAYRLDRRHRSVAHQNIASTIGSEWAPWEVAALARENFRRIGENFACAIKTAAMDDEQLKRHLSIDGLENVTPGEGSRVFAIGHFGNFEIYSRFAWRIPGRSGAATYRALRQPGLNRLLQELRSRSNLVFFERRTEQRALQRAMAAGGLFLGLLADQHAGKGGSPLSFLGRDCSVSLAPGVFARRYRAPLHVAVCYRTGLARWRIEIGEEIPIMENDRLRSAEALIQEVNRRFETAVRKDPANWFWVHNRWKTRGRPMAGADPEDRSAPERLSVGDG